MSSLLFEKPSVYQAAKARWEEAKRRRDDLVSALAGRDAQRKAAEARVSDLQCQRDNVVRGVGLGTHGDADLTKIRKQLDSAKDTLVDASEVFESTRQALTEAEKDFISAEREKKVAERKAWRGVAESLIQTHKQDLQGIWDKVFIALSLQEPGVTTLYWSVPNTFNLKPPTADQTAQIRRELAEEFGL